MDERAAGRIVLGVDPFFYVDEFSHEPSAPALIYDWCIRKIEIQTAPMTETEPRVLRRDPARLGWREVEATDAWTDDDGHAEYLLHCERVGGTPRRTLQP